MQSVIETPGYLADAKSAGMTDDERQLAVNTVAADPAGGDLIVGTGGARKVRIAGRGKGKSGGYRIVTFFGGGDIPVFLLAVFSKGDRANLSKAERNMLASELAGLAADYRAGGRTR